MIYGDLFNKLFDAIDRIESYLGLLYYNDDYTVSGRLNNLEISAGKDNIVPVCEKDILVTGDNFTVSYEPIIIGDSWTVNNSAIITVSDTAEEKEVDEWGDIEFQGVTGTLMGADGNYDGKLVTITYYTKQNMLYYGIIFDGGYPETRKVESEPFDLIIADSVLQENQRIFIDSKGRTSSFSVSEPLVGTNIFDDLSNGLRYELYAENGQINWRTV